jgi:hypothetical protein
MYSAVLPHLPHDRFTGEAKASWWVKFVQLDLEAKRQIVREPSKPLRWHKKLSRKVRPGATGQRGGFGVC